MGIEAISGVITAGSCKYRQQVDNPHWSYKSTLAWGEASVHGRWLRYSGTCPTYNNVDVTLQALFCDPFGCYWRTQSSSSVDRKSGIDGVARHACKDWRLVGYRGVVDVDLIGVSDPGGVEIEAADVECYPA